jgi:pimeloyl-ACP methyl ester carboxylesterase
MRLLQRTGLAATRDLDEIAAIVDSFKDPATRRAIQHVVSHVVDWRGQVITMVDRAYLTEAMPICVIWGEDDMVIPVDHAHVAQELAPGAQVHVMKDSGHFPHKDHPDRFVRIVNDFIRKTEPAQYHRGRWRALLRGGRSGPRLVSEDSKTVTA